MCKPQRRLSCLLQVCAEKKDPKAGRRAHVFIISRGLEAVAILGNHLIRLFTSCGSLLEANLVFCKIAKPSVYTWYAIISAYAIHGESAKILELYNKMQQDRIQINEFVSTCILKACGSEQALGQGKLIHEEIIRCGFESNLAVGNSLIDMYCKCARLNDAHTVFNHLPNHNIVSWGSIIAGYAQHGHGFPALVLFNEMQLECCKPNRVIFLCTIKACSNVGALGQGKLIHEQIMKNELELDVAIGSTLIDMYAKCGSLQEAQSVLDQLPIKNIVSWGTMIAGYVQHGHDCPALELFHKMQQDGIKPDRATFSCILKACGSIGAISQGKLIHKEINVRGFEVDVVIGSHLVDMYAKCGSMYEAQNVFDKLPNRNVLPWSVMIAAYAHYGQGNYALELFEKMQEEGIQPDKVMYLFILKACVTAEALGKGRLVHGQIVRRGFESDVLVGSTLVDMYAKCNNLQEAHQLFGRLPNRDIVTWGVMIRGYAQFGQSLAALDLFVKMQHEGVKPDNVLFSCTLKACACIGAIEHGMLIHDQIIRCGLQGDAIIGSTLIELYAKSGSPEEPSRVFDELSNQDLVSWGAMIAGYAEHGNYKLAGQCLQDMLQQGLKPDNAIFTSILSACSQAGEVEAGRWYFKLMSEKHGIKPSIVHINCMIDLLGCTGHLSEAQQFLQARPFSSDITGWMSLLTACRKYGDMELGRKCFEEIVQLDPSAPAAYVIMLNIYADAHMWDDVNKIHELRICNSAWKKPGMAWIESNSIVREFVVGDTSHDEMSAASKRLRKSLQEEGYMPHLDLVIEKMIVNDMKMSCLETDLLFSS